MGRRDGKGWPPSGHSETRGLKEVPRKDQEITRLGQFLWHDSDLKFRQWRRACHVESIWSPRSRRVGHAVAITTKLFIRHADLCLNPPCTNLTPYSSAEYTGTPDISTALSAPVTATFSRRAVLCYKSAFYTPLKAVSC